MESANKGSLTVSARESDHRVMPFVLPLAFVGPLSIDAFLPGMQSIGGHFSVNVEATSTLLSGYLLGYAFMALWHGALADAFGRKAPTLVTTAIYVAASFYCAAAETLGQLQVGRLMQGLVAGAGLVIARAMLRDVFTGAELQRRFSLLVATLAIPPVVGPLLGGELVQLASWRAIFFALGALGLTLLICCAAWMPETLARARRSRLRPKDLLKAYARVGFNRDFFLPIGATAFLFAGQFVYIGGSPAIILRHYGLTERDFAQLFLPVTAGVVLGGVVGSWMAAKVKPRSQALAGLVLACTGAAIDIVIGARVWQMFPITFFPSLLYAMGIVLVTPVATSETLSRAAANVGVVSSCQVFTQTMGLVAAAWFVVPHFENTLLGLALAKAALCLAGTITWIVSRRR